jgi:hypothetical protein
VGSIALSEVRRRKAKSTTERCVLMILADISNDAGDNIFIGKETMALEIDAHLRTIQKIYQDLVKRKVLNVLEWRDGNPARYQFVWENLPVNEDMEARRQRLRQARQVKPLQPYAEQYDLFEEKPGAGESQAAPNESDAATKRAIDSPPGESQAHHNYKGNQPSEPQSKPGTKSAKKDARVEQDKWPLVPAVDGTFKVPEPYDTHEAFRKSFTAYHTRRMGMKKDKRPTHRALELLFMMLAKYPVASAIHGLDASEVGGWVGVPEDVVKKHAEAAGRQNNKVLNDEGDEAFDREVQRRKDEGEFF